MYTINQLSEQVHGINASSDVHAIAQNLIKSCKITITEDQFNWLFADVLKACFTHKIDIMNVYKVN
jgi:hypothetical protein